MQTGIPPSRRWWFGLVAALSLATFPVPAVPDCPENHVNVNGMANFSNEARLSLYHSDGATRYGLASYDLTMGTIAASAGPALSVALVVAVDDFEITGMLPSTPIACTIRLTLQGSLSRIEQGHLSGGTASASLRYSQFGSGDSVQASFDGSYAYPRLIVTEPLELGVVITSGSPFRVEFRLQIQGEIAVEESQMSGTFSFQGLPPGTGVRSCNGFLQPAVAVQPRAWTQVKALYRGSRVEVSPR